MKKNQGTFAYFFLGSLLFSILAHSEPQVAKLPPPPQGAPNTDSYCVGSTIQDIIFMKRLCPLDEKKVCTPEEAARQHWDCFFNKKGTLCGKVKLPNGRVVGAETSEGHSAIEGPLARIYIAIQNKFCKANPKEGFGITNRLEEIIDNLMAGDPVAIVCTGMRTFPGGTKKPTQHAVTVCKGTDGNIYVYDPNDPEVGWTSCTFDENGLAWSCRYYDVGKPTIETSQCYNVSQELESFLRSIGSRCNPPPQKK